MPPVLKTKKILVKESSQLFYFCFCPRRRSRRLPTDRRMEFPRFSLHDRYYPGDRGIWRDPSLILDREGVYYFGCPGFSVDKSSPLRLRVRRVFCKMISSVNLSGLDRTAARCREFTDSPSFPHAFSATQLRTDQPQAEARIQGMFGLNPPLKTRGVRTIE